MANDTEQQAEERPVLPTYPKQGELVPVELDGRFRYFIDPSSISVAADGLVRYTLVARSGNGATNVSYEGLRCGSREHAFYAFGRADGTWSTARKLQWNSVGSGYFAILADYYFCPDRRAVTDAAEALQALKLGRHPALTPKTY